jgi:hypothetical protein
MTGLTKLDPPAWMVRGQIVWREVVVDVVLEVLAVLVVLAALVLLVVLVVLCEVEVFPPPE